MNPQVDAYLSKSKRWREETAELRAILLDCGLGEALKWGKPCYTAEDNNIAIIQPMKNFLALMFFKGALIDDVQGVLEEQGEHSRSQRRMCFTSVQQVVEAEEALRNYVQAAIEVERAGLTVPKPTELVLVEELQARLDEDPALNAAFEALTPGRQREYHLHFSGAKQSKTRTARIEKFVPKILAGKGFRDL